MKFSYKAFKPWLIHHLPFPLLAYSAALWLSTVNLRHGPRLPHLAREIAITRE
jgi:hypothetical protein